MECITILRWESDDRLGVIERGEQKLRVRKLIAFEIGEVMSRELRDAILWAAPLLAITSSPVRKTRKPI